MIRRMRRGFRTSLLALWGVGASLAAERCPEVRWLTPGEGLPKNGVVAVSIHKDALARIGGLEQGDAILRQAPSGDRIRLDRLESMGGADGDARLYVFRPGRELRPGSSYKFLVPEVELKGLERTFKVGSATAEFLVPRPPRISHRRSGAEAGTVVFDGKLLEDSAWVTVELQESVAPDTEEADEQEFYRWEASSFHRIVPTRTRDGTRLVLRADPCAGGIAWKPGHLYRARFSLVSKHGFTTTASSWQLFRAPRGE